MDFLVDICGIRHRAADLLSQQRGVALSQPMERFERERESSSLPPPADHGRVPQRSPCFINLAGRSMFRNKIPETLEPDCLCNGMKTPDHEQKFQLDGTEEPGFQKTLDCHGDLRNVRGCSRQRSNLDDECCYGIAISDFAHVNSSVPPFLSVHTARRCPGR
jgi:hypothetical protein